MKKQALNPVAALLAVSVLPSAALAEAPKLEERGGQAFVVWQGDKIVQLGNYRRLRFRSSGYNDHWIGARNGLDLCWAYHDVKDYVVAGKSFRATGDGFVLEIDADKPSVRGRVHTRLEGKLISPEFGFKYTLSSKLTAAQKEWREVSKPARHRKPEEAAPVEALDYRINRISPSELNEPTASMQGVPELYDAFVISPDGKNWESIPKLPVPSLLRKGRYPAISWKGENFGRPGQRMGMLDRREGGWIVELEDTSAPLNIEVCWMFYDLHNMLPTGIPPWTPGKDTFETRYTLAFTPVAPGQAREVLDRAKPIEWQSLPEYQLPVFTRYNTFEKMLSRSSDWAWFASSYHCAVDRNTGYDDSYSVRIQHDKADLKSAWYAWTWGPCFDHTAPLDGAYRFSAMVKSKDLTAPFRLAVAEFLQDLWLLPDGRWSTSPGGPDTVVTRTPRIVWHYSPQQVTGTSDWTRLTIDLPIDNEQFKPGPPTWVRRGVVLEYQGKGTVWIDNVRIVKIE